MAIAAILDRSIIQISMETSPAKRSPIVTLIAVAVGVVAGFTAVRHFNDRPANIDQALVATTSQINKGCPMMVDKETRLDNTMAAPDKTIVYRYTLVNTDAASVQKDRLVSALRPQVLTNYKTNPSMKELRDNGVTMQYQYSDRKGTFITEFAVSPKDF